MNKKHIKARLLFVIGLFILIFDMVIFFQPSTRVQADSNIRPTIQKVSTGNPKPDQPQAPTTVPDDNQNPTDVPSDSSQNAPTSEPAHATDKPANIDAPTAGSIQATTVPVNTDVAQTDAPT